MFLKNKTCLALATLTAIVHHSASESLVSASTLVQRYQLSPRALEPILQPLAKAGFVRSLRGGQGGYEVVSPETLSVADVIRALEPVALPKQPLYAFQSTLEQTLAPAQATLLEQLAHITIADLAKQASDDGISSELEPILNFSI